MSATLALFRFLHRSSYSRVFSNPCLRSLSPFPTRNIDFRLVDRSGGGREGTVDYFASPFSLSHSHLSFPTPASFYSTLRYKYFPTGVQDYTGVEGCATRMICAAADIQQNPGVFERVHQPMVLRYTAYIASNGENFGHLL
ncbi:hypothetical protein TNCV_169351 [Trichonephila clavipes]|nr:hypothetical protein TNCV_169351 [Trichonephila clavipes]